MDSPLLYKQKNALAVCQSLLLNESVELMKVRIALQSLLAIFTNRRDVDVSVFVVMNKLGSFLRIQFVEAELIGAEHVIANVADLLPTMPAVIIYVHGSRLPAVHALPWAFRPNDAGEFR